MKDAISKGTELTKELLRSRIQANVEKAHHQNGNCEHCKTLNDEYSTITGCQIVDDAVNSIVLDFEQSQVEQEDFSLIKSRLLYLYSSENNDGTLKGLF